MITLTDSEQNIVQLELSGKVTAHDYKELRPKLKELFSREGKERFLFDLRHLNWLSVGAIIQDIRLDLQNFRFIGTTAVVTDSKAIKAFVGFMDKIYPEKIRAFTDKQDALSWLHANYTGYSKDEFEDLSAEDIL